MNCLQGVAEGKCTQRVFTGPMISGFAGRVAGTSKLGKRTNHWWFLSAGQDYDKPQNSPAGQPSDKLTPQETTNQDSHDVESDGASLSGACISVVAGCGGESGRFDGPTGSVTLCADLVRSFSTQSPTEDQEVGEELMKPDHAR